jgi:ribosomal protein S18 acetylase RimI-like enzyme
MSTAYELASYQAADERSWLRCRVLSFLDTDYYDDVATSKPDLDVPVQLVVKRDGAVVALLDASLDGADATIETVAVHPDHRRHGLASRLLGEALARLGALGAERVDAWTREDAAALGWYADRGFREETRYLHVYPDAYAEDLAAPLARAVRDACGLTPMRIFAHAPIERETELRAAYRRVYVCRQLVRPVPG